MGDYDDPSLTGQDRRRGPALAIGAAVLTLVIGLAVGFVVGGGTSRDSSVASVESSPASTPAPTSEAPTSAPSAPGTPQACLEAGSAAAAVLEELEAAVAAIGAFDPTALREILDRLQPLQGQLQGAVGECGVGLSGAPGPTG